MELVRLREPEKMNLLGLLLQGFFRQALERPFLQRYVRRMSGNVCLRAGPLWATLQFDGQGIEIVRGRCAQCGATVQGEMHALLSLVTGEAVLTPFLRREVSIGGNPLMLAKMLPLLAAGR